MISIQYQIDFGMVIKEEKEHKAKGNGFGYSIFNETSPYTNTLSARYYKDGSEILIEQNKKSQKINTSRSCTTTRIS